ncbi:hypothetical protein AXG93_1474s1030 [Marchantia polymorpha subsp. ruderalis]|uniref:Uncharacterized protein n=1 Tax=Marchantia polymorpha subsp. ruderalis TaxID=1480154 RepID=A0A176WAE3_MARPO|nr:hypothetical protein AXG93_1474s1030 [Marchantia polymorpha subsp. ruderalis]
MAQSQVQGQVQPQAMGNHEQLDHGSDRLSSTLPSDLELTGVGAAAQILTRNRVIIEFFDVVISDSISVQNARTLRFTAPASSLESQLDGSSNRGNESVTHLTDGSKPSG